MQDTSSWAHYLPYLFAALGVIGALIRLRMSRRAENRRSAQLADFARSVGLQIAIQSDADDRGTWFSNSGSEPTRASVLDKFYGFQPFLEGDSSPRVQNVITGARDGLDWCMFDYSYEGSGRDRTEYRFAIVAASVPVVFPKLTVEPENFLAKIGEHFGLRKLNFEVNEFNRRYCVTCSDEKRAYDILCPETIECLLAFPSRWWQFGGSYIVIAQEGVLLPDLCLEIMREIPAFLAKIPDYVRQDIGLQAQTRAST